jgi:hypothetical protein
VGFFRDGFIRLVIDNIELVLKGVFGGNYIFLMSNQVVPELLLQIEVFIIKRVE